MLRPACANAQSDQNLHCLCTQCRDIDEGLGQNLCLYHHLMAKYACIKNDVICMPYVPCSLESAQFFESFFNNIHGIALS